MKYVMLSMLAFFFVACGGYNQGIVQQAEKGYLKFIGNTQDVKVVIDDGGEIALVDKNHVYQVKPGRHEVKAFRSGHLVLNRIVVLDNQTTMEIEIP